MSKDVEKTEYGTGTWDTPPSDEDYTLEEILAEYGSSRQQKIMEEVERETAPAEPDTPKAPAPEQPSAPEPTETAPSPTPKSAMALWEERIAAAALEQDGEAPLADDSDPEEEPRTDDGPEPEATRFLSLEELVGTTVGAVMEEHHETLLKPKRGLFSRKWQEETEQLYDSMEAPEESVKPLTEAESIGEEPELSEVASEEREAYKSRHRSLGFAFFTALVPIAAMAAEQSGVTVPFWTGDRQIQGVAMLACLLIELVLCWHVPVYAIRKLSEKRCVSALLVSLAVVAAAVDCALWLLVPGRGEALPYTAAAGLALCFAQWGISRESRGSYDSFRLASLDDHPPYLVTETPRGACKQRGDLRGFYTTAMRDDYASRLQTVFLPVIFMAAQVLRLCRHPVRRQFHITVRDPDGGSHLFPAAVLEPAMVPADPPTAEKRLCRGGLGRRGPGRKAPGHDPDGYRPVPAGDHPAQRGEGLRRGTWKGVGLCGGSRPCGGLRPGAGL